MFVRSIKHLLPIIQKTGEKLCPYTNIVVMSVVKSLKRWSGFLRRTAVRLALSARVSTPKRKYQPLPRSVEVSRLVPLLLPAAAVHAAALAEQAKSLPAVSWRQPDRRIIILTPVRVSAIRVCFWRFLSGAATQETERY